MERLRCAPLGVLVFVGVLVSAATGASILEVTTMVPEDADCSDQSEYSNNPELLERLKKYDVEKILDEVAELPGNLTLTAQNAPEPEVEDASVRPLPDTDNQTYWQYDLRNTDWKTFIHLEHAVARRKGSPDEFLDVRGELWWTPPDLCGGLRHAKYRRDDTGFHAEVLRAHCTIFRKTGSLSCFGPDSENPCGSCISALSGGLIASLVG